MYEVIKHFTDLQDDNHPYYVGETFPRKGLKVTDERLAELAGSNNKQGQPLIKKVEEPEAAETPEEVETPTDEAAAEKPAKKGAKKTAEK